MQFVFFSYTIHHIYSAKIYFFLFFQVLTFIIFYFMMLILIVSFLSVLLILMVLSIISFRKRDSTTSPLNIGLQTLLQNLIVYFLMQCLIIALFHSHHDIMNNVGVSRWPYFTSILLWKE